MFAHIRLPVFLAVFVGFMPASGATATAAVPPQWQFIHSGPESANDRRYDYHWRVLQAALDATQDQYGPYVISRGDSMSESRQIRELSIGSGKLNTLVLDATTTLEQRFQAVKIPIDKGLLGYRVFLIRAENQPRFSAVKTLDDLRQLSMGQGQNWSDVSIYRAAGFTVTTGSSYEGLFKMLMAKRFDGFGRGVSEVLGELSAWQPTYPQMAIERELLLYYPLPVYFWFERTVEGSLRRQRVEEGMRILVANGELERLFNAEYASTIQALQLGKRRLLTIPNPNLPPDQPFDNQAYWFTPPVAPHPSQ